MQRHKVATTVPSGLVSKMSKPLPDGTEFYLEPIGEHTNKVLADLLGNTDTCSRKCDDGEPHGLRPATSGEVHCAEESRKTDLDIHFSLWYKDKLTGEIKLRKSDYAYIHRNPSLNPRCKRGLRSSLITGDGKSARIPRRRGFSGPTMLRCGDWETRGKLP